jgi:hypothetical protein
MFVVEGDEAWTPLIIVCDDKVLKKIFFFNKLIKI